MTVPENGGWRKLVERTQKRSPRTNGQEFSTIPQAYSLAKKYRKTLPVQTNLLDLPNAKKRQFSMEAFACDLSHLRQLKAAKRYVYIILFIEQQMGKVYDDLILMFTRRMYNLRNNAKALRRLANENRSLL